jgi:hypothetical protein
MCPSGAVSDPTAGGQIIANTFREKLGGGGGGFDVSVVGDDCRGVGVGGGDEDNGGVGGFGIGIDCGASSVQCSVHWPDCDDGES